MTIFSLKKIFPSTLLLISFTVFTPLAAAGRYPITPAVGTHSPRYQESRIAMDTRAAKEQPLRQQALITAIRNNSLAGVKAAMATDSVHFIGGLCCLADDKGLTPLMIACSNHKTDIDIVRLVRTNGGPIHATTKDTGKTALMFACDATLGPVNLEMVEELLEGGNPHVCDKNSHSAVWYAVEDNNQRLLNLFFSKHAIVDDLLLEQTVDSPLHPFLVAYKQINEERAKQQAMLRRFPWGLAEQPAKDIVAEVNDRVFLRKQ